MVFFTHQIHIQRIRKDLVTKEQQDIYFHHFSVKITRIFLDSDRFTKVHVALQIKQCSRTPTDEKVQNLGILTVDFGTFPLIVIFLLAFSFAILIRCFGAIVN